MWWTCIAPLLLAGVKGALLDEAQATCHLQTQTSQTPANAPDYGHPSWLGSCSSIYLDVGSNKGVQIRKLFEPELYPDSMALPIFTKAFGAPSERCKPATESGICVLGLEPNPQHQDRLKKLAAAYQNYGWRVNFYFMAGSTKDGQVSFTGNGGGADIAAHLTLLQWEDVPVRAIDLASFIQSLPARSVKLMKMDIEGEEFNVVDRMAEKGALCKDVVQTAFVEVHNVTSITTWANTSRWGGREPNADGLATFIQGQPCEHGTMELLPIDDESYLDDVNEDFGSANSCRNDAPPRAVTAAAA